MRKLLLALLLLLPILAQAQPTPPTPKYSGVIFNPQSGTPAGVAEGQCWTQTNTALWCWYNGGAHLLLASGSTIPLTVGNTTIASGTSGRVLYDNAGVLGEYTATQLTAQINAFTSSLSGAAPSSGGGTTNFLRADGTWSVPPGTATGTVTTTGSPANGNLSKFSGASSITNGDLSGDATTLGTLVVTLATVNSNVGSFGDGTHVGSFTVDAKGRITAASSVAITGAAPTGSASGDLSGSYPGPTVAKVNGATYPAAPAANTVPVVTSATSGGTITYEQVPNAAIANPSITIAGHSVSLGGSQAIACADLSNGATGCSTATGTSGATIPLLNGANTWSGVQSFNSGDVALKGATSGTITLNAAATAGSNTITLPGGTTDFSATGGTSQVIKQTSSGGAFTVGQLACGDMSNSGTACQKNTGTSGANVPLLNGTNVWTGQQSVTPTTLTISTATFTPDGTSNNYSMTLVHASCPCTLANPSATPVAGTAGQIIVIQSATGSDTIGTYGSQYEAAGGTSTLTLSTGANAVDILSYYVRDSTHIELALQKNFSH